jgi:hypothetical protein
MTEVIAPRRHTLTDAYNDMQALLVRQHEERMAQAARSSEPSVSVECDDTAKGDTTPTVKLYAPLGCDLAALQTHAEEVARIAVDVHKTTRAAFPRQA